MPIGQPEEGAVAVIGEIGVTPVPVPGREDVSLPPRGALGMENGGEVPVPVNEVPLDVVTGEIGVVAEEVLKPVVADVVTVWVSVSGNVMVVWPVLKGAVPVPTGAVGAVFHGAVSLHGVGKAGEEESDPVTGLPSVEELAPEGTGK